MKTQFTITSKVFKDGIIPDKYGKRGECDGFGMPVVSPPLEFNDLPEGTVSIALVCEDKDAFKVSGFSWVHWTAANITTTALKEDASRSPDGFVQGLNSCFSILGGRRNKAEVACYGGMAPPDAPHVYEFHAYALDCKLDLKDGFYMNDLYKAMDGHVLAQSTLKGLYRN